LGEVGREPHERLEDTHGEIIKRESDMQVRKKTRTNKEEMNL